MGTSGSFSGSGGKDARDLRDNIAAWLDSVGEPDGSEAIDLGNADKPSPEPSRPDTPIQQPRVDIGPALRLLISPRGRKGSADGPGGGGGGGAEGGGGRSSGGPIRSVSHMSRAAGRAGSLALAYSSGDREALREAGLNYDELQALGNPVAVGLKIVEAAFESRADSTIADAEERDIVSSIVEWILQHPADCYPTPEEIVRKSIETTIAETVLTEVSSMVFAKEVSFEKRRNLEHQIRDVAAEYAAQAALSPSGASEKEMSQAIENGIRDIGKIFGASS